jgi:hypothetical protein
MLSENQSEESISSKIRLKSNSSAQAPRFLRSFKVWINVRWVLRFDRWYHGNNSNARGSDVFWTDSEEAPSNDICHYSHSPAGFEEFETSQWDSSEDKLSGHGSPQGQVTHISVASEFELAHLTHMSYEFEVS